MVALIRKKPVSCLVTSLSLACPINLSLSAEIAEFGLRFSPPLETASEELDQQQCACCYTHVLIFTDNRLTTAYQSSTPCILEPHSENKKNRGPKDLCQAQTTRGISTFPHPLNAHLTSPRAQLCYLASLSHSRSSSITAIPPQQCLPPLSSPRRPTKRSPSP